jgi:hypothetical protein
MRGQVFTGGIWRRKEAMHIRTREEVLTETGEEKIKQTSKVLNEAK